MGRGVEAPQQCECPGTPGPPVGRGGGAGSWGSARTCLCPPPPQPAHLCVYGAGSPGGRRGHINAVCRATPALPPHGGGRLHCGATTPQRGERTAPRPHLSKLPAVPRAQRFWGQSHGHALFAQSFRAVELGLHTSARTSRAVPVGGGVAKARSAGRGLRPSGRQAHSPTPTPHSSAAPQLHYGRGREDAAVAHCAPPVPGGRPPGAQPLGPALQRCRGQEGPCTSPRPAPQQLHWGRGGSARWADGSLGGGRCRAPGTRLTR